MLAFIEASCPDREVTALKRTVNAAKKAVAEQVDLPPGYSITWSGQYEYMERAKQHLAVVIPFTIITIILLLFLIFRNVVEVLIILGTLPMALTGGLWAMNTRSAGASIALL